MFIHSYPNTNELGDPVYIAAFAKLPLLKNREIRAWCYETYGWPGYQAANDFTRWRDDIAFGEVEFTRESDLALFLLRWS